jgi:hypothetical protein
MSDDEASKVSSGLEAGLFSLTTKVSEAWFVVSAFSSTVTSTETEVSFRFLLGPFFATIFGVASTFVFSNSLRAEVFAVTSKVS